MEYLKFFEKLENVPVVLLLLLSIATGIVLFAPSELLEALFLDEFLSKHGVYVGVAFLLMLALLVSRVILGVSRVIASTRKTKKSNLVRTNYLEKLTPEEKGYLAPYILDQRNTVNVGLDDGIMGGLVSKGICHMSSRMFDMLNGASYNLQPWAREHLDANPHLLEGAEGEPMTPQQKLHARRNY